METNTQSPANPVASPLPSHIMTQIRELCEWYSSHQIRTDQWKLLQVALQGAADQDGRIAVKLVSDWIFTQVQITELLSAILDHYGDQVVSESLVVED